MTPPLVTRFGVTREQSEDLTLFLMAAFTGIYFFEPTTEPKLTRPLRKRKHKRTGHTYVIVSKGTKT